MAKERERERESKKVRTVADAVEDLRKFMVMYDLEDKPFEGYGSVRFDYKISDKRTREISFDLGTGNITKTETLFSKL